MEIIYLKTIKIKNKLINEDIKQKEKIKLNKDLEILKNHFNLEQNNYDKEDKKFTELNEIFKNLDNYKIQNNNILKEIDYIEYQEENNNLDNIYKTSEDIKNINNQLNEITNETFDKLKNIEKNYEITDENLIKSKKVLIDTYKIKTDDRISKLKGVITGTGALLGGVLTLGNPFGIGAGSAIGYKIGTFFGKKIKKKAEKNIENIDLTN